MSRLSFPPDADLAAADLHARSHPRDAGAPAHWCRCNTVIDDKRCLRPDPHPGEHAFAKGAP